MNRFGSSAPNIPHKFSRHSKIFSAAFAERRCPETPRICGIVFHTVKHCRIHILSALSRLVALLSRYIKIFAPPVFKFFQMFQASKIPFELTRASFTVSRMTSMSAKSASRLKPHPETAAFSGVGRIFEMILCSSKRYFFICAALCFGRKNHKYFSHNVSSRFVIGNIKFPMYFIREM